jgi:hypothetical protein
MIETRPATGRDDIEWAFGSNGWFLRDKPNWTAAHTRQIEERREAERQTWLRNHRARSDASTY